MNSNISLAVVGPESVQVEREGLVIGELVLKEIDKKPVLEAYGFSNLRDTGGCGRFLGKSDCVADYVPRETRVHKSKYSSEFENLAVALNLEAYNLKHYAAELSLGCRPGELSLNPVSDTQVEIVSGKRKVADFWSQLKGFRVSLAGNFPDSRNPYDSIQICGIGKIEGVSPVAGENAFYIARARIFQKQGGLDNRFSSDLQFRAGSVEDVFQKLYAAGAGIEAAISAIDTTHQAGTVKALFDGLKSDPRLLS